MAELERKLAAVTAERDRLRKAVEPVLEMWDEFNDEGIDGITYENAYYCFYKRKSSQWDALKAALRGEEVQGE